MSKEQTVTGSRVVKDVADPLFKGRGMTPLEIAIDDALYNPKEEDLPYGYDSDRAGWGLQRPDPRWVSYQRLWEYYVQMDILREAVANDIAVTGQYPAIEYTYNGGVYHGNVLQYSLTEETSDEEGIPSNMH